MISETREARLQPSRMAWCSVNVHWKASPGSTCTAIRHSGATVTSSGVRHSRARYADSASCARAPSSRRRSATVIGTSATSNTSCIGSLNPDRANEVRSTGWRATARATASRKLRSSNDPLSRKVWTLWYGNRSGSRSIS